MSERLKNYDFYSQLLIIYYSLWLIIITIVDIDTPTIDVSIPTLIVSIIILVMSVFVYAMNFGKRAGEVQKNYTAMQKILGKMKRLSSTIKVEEEYYSILESSENHSTCDFFKVRYDVRNQKEYLKENGVFPCLDYFKYFCCWIKQRLAIILLFLLPIIAVFLNCTYSVKMF